MEPEIKRIEPDFPLPEPVIQHIQSFLGGKEAAQTTILSKSWYTAWLTRPHLEFDQRHLGCSSKNPGDEKGFWEFVQKTMQRYEELNLKIESLRLLVRGEYSAKPDKCFRGNEFIRKAMKMGVSDLYFEILFRYRLFNLPHEVLGSETLTRLSVVGCKEIDLGVVRCSKLKSLSLRAVHLPGDVTWDILSCCPLIEKLSLSECRMLPDTVFKKRSIDRGPIELYGFHKLKCLVLTEVNIDPLMFNDFSSRFSCLKELILNDCSACNFKRIRISSRSLEFITISQSKMLRADLDVPSIRKFKFRSHSVPCLKLESSSTNWESDISIICRHFCTSWCIKLRLMLTSFSLSRICLSLTILPGRNHNIDFEGLRRTASEKMAVESLTMDAAYSVCFTLLEFFFRCSRPKFVILYVPLYKGWNANSDCHGILPKRRARGHSLRSTLRQIMFGSKEVRMKSFDEVVAGWQPLAISKSVDASTRPEEPNICFQLTW